MSDVTVPTQAEMAALRGVIGESAALWARLEMRVRPGSWRAFSGSRHVDYNVVCAHDPEGREDLLDGLAALTERRTPGLCMLAGPALGLARDLADEGLVCVTATPLVVFSLTDDGIDPDVRLLGPAERQDAWAIVADAFGLDDATAAVALPVEQPPEEATDRVYGLFDGGALVSVVGMGGTGDAVSGWSMATPTGLRRRGYGKRLMHSALAAEHQRGASRLVALSSPLGLPLYLGGGATILEYWQVWSRPRWVFGR